MGNLSIQVRRIKHELVLNKIPYRHFRIIVGEIKQENLQEGYSKIILCGNFCSKVFHRHANNNHID